MTQEPPAPAPAPAGWRNWRAHSSGVPEGGTVEFVLHSDSHWVAEITEGLGPYQVLNLVGGGIGTHVGHAHPALALRASYHLEGLGPTFPVPEKARSGSYHAGWIDGLDVLGVLVAQAQRRWVLRRVRRPGSPDTWVNS